MSEKPFQREFQVRGKSFEILVEFYFFGFFFAIAYSVASMKKLQTRHTERS